MPYCKRPSKVCALLLFWGAFAGCSGMDSTSDTTTMVVERNKSAIPAWTQLEEDTLYANSERYRFLFVRKDLDHLTLGIKQAQIEAMAASQRALFYKVCNELKQAKDQENLSPQKAQAYQKLESEVKKFHNKYAEVADIYYERRIAAAGTSHDHYDTYILIYIAKEPLQQLIAKLQQELEVP